MKLLFAVLVALGLGSMAFADPIQLRLTDGVATVLVVDGGVGDLNPLAGAVTFIGAVGNWILNVSTGVGSLILGPSRLDLNSIDVQAGAAGALQLLLTETGLGTVFSGWEMGIGGFLASGPGASVRYDAYQDNSNAVFGLASLIGSLGPFGPGAFSGTGGGQTLIPSATAPYSLTQVITINVPAGFSSFSANATLDPVPEPASLLLLGTGLLGLGGIARKKIKGRKNENV